MRLMTMTKEIQLIRKSFENRQNIKNIKENLPGTVAKNELSHFFVYKEKRREIFIRLGLKKCKRH